MQQLLDKSPLVRLFGFGATLVHGDLLVLDRWLWLRERLPKTANKEALLDVGSGSGAFTIGSALRGYQAIGLSWDERNQAVAAERARLCGALRARFEVLDVRILDTRQDLAGQFDFALCLETAEHIINDAKLLRDIAVCLKGGGRLLFTAPYYHYRAITKDDLGPFPKIESGWHVRRGYTEAMLYELCEQAGLMLERVSYCGGFLSQKITFVWRMLNRIHPIVGFALTLPFRMIPLLFDPMVTRLLGYPQFSICMEAHKPRYASSRSIPRRDKVAGHATRLQDKSDMRADRRKI